MTPWRIGIDTGGTFTDGVAVAPDGSRRRVKILSTGALRGRSVRWISADRLEVREQWDTPTDLVRGFRFRLLDCPDHEGEVAAYDSTRHELRLTGSWPGPRNTGCAFEVVSPEEAPLLAARLLTGTPYPQPLPPMTLRLATTLGTNALLQGAGVPTALFITRGFADLLFIGTQQRPDLFALDIRRPDPLHGQTVEVPERLAADGSVLLPLDLDALSEQVEAVLRDGIRVAAVALLHADVDHSHERRLQRFLLDRGFEHVSCSHAVARQTKLLPRAQTAVTDAYLSPVVREYLERIRSGLGDTDDAAGHLLVMTSAGGLSEPDGFRPKDSLLSGPAGGVVGAAHAGRRSGASAMISFDMGGTSTDVARIDGDYEYVYEHRVGPVQLVAPALAIETVAAGGGSVCWLDGERLRVGPRSAGASPGPACYGSGGPLTVTDVNLLAGRLDEARFEIPIRLGPARERLRELTSELQLRTGQPVDPDGLLEGLLDIANERMADAIRRISLRRGFDPEQHSLIAFGGAGGQHACALAEALSISRIIVPPDASLLSAFGLGRAVLERIAQRQLLEPLGQVTDIADQIADLEREATASVQASGVEKESVEVRRRSLYLRFAGQENSLDVEWGPELDIPAAFGRRYAELFGHRPESREVEIESIRVIASAKPAESPVSRSAESPYVAEPERSREMLLEGRRQEIAVYSRSDLTPGASLFGPALIEERHSATVVESGWLAEIDTAHALVLYRQKEDRQRPAVQQPESVRLELFTQRFHTLVREMGERLERTAVSTNVKERLDFSCALLDPRGELVVNAPHIPVHLGALGLCVRRVAETLALEPGDVVVTNHPAFGGSHLPDVTVITPVFSGNHPEQLLGYTASRAHHAEIGGTRPGSMPPDAHRLTDEGVVLAPDYLIRAGRERWEATRRRLLEGAFPTRAVEDNLADLRAATAANHSGARALEALAATHGDATILSYMEALQRLAESRMREALAAIPDGLYEARELLDDGSPLAVRIELAGSKARIDFHGSSDVHPGNLNATPAIVQSAVLYVLRLLLHRPLPLNEGLLRAVEIVLPTGILNPPFDRDPAPAVVGGNVETSQRLVDTLLKALGVAACSQGTMNNIIFGNAGYGYYETLGGGCGAGRHHDGASSVHSHMTNTRITDPEILERRYPVRVERFAVRRGSGGRGRRRGGDGLVRELRFLEPASLSILSQHRRVAPYGLEGGGPGLCGRQRVVRSGGETEELDAIDGCELNKGDRLIVETPGGGGFGTPDGNEE